MAEREPSAAQALYGHLPSASREPVQQRTPNIADALYPSLSRSQKRWDEWRSRQRDILLKCLREANGKGAR